MGHFNSPTRDYATTPVRTVRAERSLEEAEDELEKWDVSALLVVDDRELPVGVLSRTDLLRAGRLRSLDGGRRRVLDLPNQRVRDVLEKELVTVAPDEPLSRAARRMVKERIHRVFVAEGARVTGVLSTWDLMQAVVDAKVRTPIQEFMSASVVSVRVDDPISLAIDRMAAAHVHGLVVMEDGWPVGIFGQLEALLAHDLPPETPVEPYMDSRMLSLPMTMPLHRAASHALAMGARRVLAMGEQGVRGILAGIDFARAVE